MNVHKLKSWPEQFHGVREGSKTHEVRVNDRGFEVGDLLILREWKPRPGFVNHALGDYTGNEVLVRITAMTMPLTFGLPDKLCCMSIKLFAWQIVT